MEVQEMTTDRSLALLHQKFDRILNELEQLKNGEVDTAGACEILGLSPSNSRNTTLLRNLRDSGVLKHWRTNGKKYFYDRREILSVATHTDLTKYR